MTLTKRKRTYHLDIKVNFGSQQQQFIKKGIRVYSKKEAIRKTLQTIKKFEHSKHSKEVWLTLRNKIPVVDSNGTWVATVLFGSPASLLHRANVWSFKAPLGCGDFYTLTKHFQ